MAAPMDEVWPAVPDSTEAGENRYLVLDRLQRFQFGHDFIAVAGLARNPARTSRRRIGQPQPPEISAEPDGQLCPIGIDCAIAVQEPVENWNSHADCCTLQHPAQE